MLAGKRVPLFVRKALVPAHALVIAWTLVETLASASRMGACTSALCHDAFLAVGLVCDWFFCK